MEEIVLKCVDAFSGRSFAGNPAGIVDRAECMSDEAMQKLASEMRLNIIEYAFMLPPSDAKSIRRLRYFTPQREIDFSGHVTIAACHSLIEDGEIELEEGTKKIFFETMIGNAPLEVHSRKERGGFVVERIMLHQQPHKFRYADVHVGELAAVLGIPPKEISATGLPIVIASQTFDWLIVPVKSKETILAMHPDLIKLAKINRRHNVVTNHIFTLDTFDPSAIAYARHFGPVLGLWEDPASAISAGALASYLREFGVTSARTMMMQQGKEESALAEILVEIESKENGTEIVLVGGRATTSISQTIKVQNGELVSC